MNDNPSISTLLNSREGVWYWGAEDWVVPLLVFGLLALVLVIWSYAQRRAALWVRLLAAALKVIALTLLALCLLEPMLSALRPRPQANAFVILADNSESLKIKNPGQRESRGQRIQDSLQPKSKWQTRLGQDFDVRRYQFDERLQSVNDFSDLNFEGPGSALGASLTALQQRFQNRPTAGVLLFSDGNATDLNAGDLLANSMTAGSPAAFETEGLPPIYAIAPGRRQSLQDVWISSVDVRQTNFETAPVTIRARIGAVGYEGQTLRVELLDNKDQVVEHSLVHAPDKGETASCRFQFAPKDTGIVFYRVRACADDEQWQFDQTREGPDKSPEATLANNQRHVAVDRGGGPYRVLYVSGRPNWEFKFLRRAVEEDPEVELVGIIRIAKKEPKFTFLGHRGEGTNPLFRGFEHQNEEDAEQYDQPVLLRVNVKDKNELRDGFPKAAETLFAFHAVVLDDVEARYFTRDQMHLLSEFVRHRGGAVLMLGGQESFEQGKYQGTPLAELLPVYLDSPGRLGPLSRPDHDTSRTEQWSPPTDDDFERANQYRFSLTRDGWLEAWMRMRSTEEEEKKRLAAMPTFHTFNRASRIKPGAVELAQIRGDGKSWPAVAVQRFGEGRSAAILIGDYWRWGLNRRESKDDLGPAWRQMIRWLVADAPRRVELEVKQQAAEPGSPMRLSVRVRDAKFHPLENARLKITVAAPGGGKVNLTPSASSSEAGAYQANYYPRQPGGYHVTVTAQAPDGSEIGRREAGFTADPATAEFQSLETNRPLLERLAEQTGGEVIPLERLSDFVADLPNRKAPIVERRVFPLWHRMGVFMLAICCLIGEWGIRRWKGLP